MIGKAKAISHGINALRYIKGESRNKNEPEKIHHVCEQYLSPDLDAMGIWLEMSLTANSLLPWQRDQHCRICRLCCAGSSANVCEDVPPSHSRSLLYGYLSDRRALCLNHDRL